jgi:hypothetical protein
MMSTNDLANFYRQLSGADLPARELSSVYCGDLLSHVMGSAPEGSAWVTVMNNVNVIAVASLTDVACVVLAAGISPSPEVIAKAEEQGVLIFASPNQVFDTALDIHGKI